MKPLVSVIITCYNQAHFLDEAVASVLSQSYDNLEIILVNDGSSDNTAQVMQNYATLPNFQLHTHETNQGAYAARNTGFATATGQYLQFLDADDWLEPQKIARQLDILEKEVSLGLLTCDFYEYFESDKTQVRTSPDVLGNLAENTVGILWTRCVIAIHSVLIRRAWLERAEGFRGGFPTTEDHDLWVRLALMGCQMRNLPEAMCYYRRHTTNTTANREVSRQAAERFRTDLTIRYPEEIGRATAFAINCYAKLCYDIQVWSNHLQEDVATLQTDANKLQDWSEHLQKDIATSQREIALVQVERDRKEEQNRALEARLSQLEHQLVLTENELGRCEQQLTEAKTLGTTWHEQLLIKNSHIQSLETLIRNLESTRIVRFTTLIGRAVNKVRSTR